VKVFIATPAPAGSRSGNRRTAQRYQRLLRDLGARAKIGTSWSGEPCDALIALHADKSAPSIHAFAAAHPERPIVVVLTGTDVYAANGISAKARAALDRAARIVALQPQALGELAPRWRERARVVLQSAVPAPRAAPPRADAFEIVAVGHLRAVKDPLRPALAARVLDDSSRIRVVHFGAALEPAFARRARAESESNPRWRWLGDRAHGEVLKQLARSRAFVQSSLSEGGSIALAEAIVAHLPVLASRIPGAIGMLGADHPGFFEPRDTRGLARLFERCENDATFRRALARRSRALAREFTPARERSRLRALFAELGIDLLA
jgi:putative glycosyltransferase (TIGR04348 family)